jgi:hypothetical protein
MSEVLPDEAVLAGLIEQFASPYDFLRELVQNGLDAGASRIDVVLREHAGDDEASTVLEIAVRDDGCGMTEAVIDNELARLFVSSKRNDRTMAGGFGVGFVSVFAWRPDAVLLQTGRHGEAWELDFDARGRLSKKPVVEPIEGTTVRLFRRERAGARETTAREIRRTLWRWCRFCRLQVWFDDDERGAPELVTDTVDAADAAVSVEHRGGDTHVRVAFAPRGRAVLLRNALVLAEGRPDALVPRVVAENPDSAEHLDVWADSAAWRTDIARDHVVDDAGRRTVEARMINLLHTCRSALVDQLEAVAALPHTAEVHARYSALHAHLRLERRTIPEFAHGRALLRGVDGPLSMEALVEAATWRVVALLDVDHGAVRRDAGVPVLVADVGDRDGWLAAWLAEQGLACESLDSLVHDVEPAARAPGDLAGRVAAIARRVGFARDVYLGAFQGPIGRPFAAQLDDATLRVAMPPARAPMRRALLWLDTRHPLYCAALEAPPALAAATLALAIGRELGAKPAAIMRAVDAMRATESSGGTP